ncbi:MAG: zinc ribbon domain-containing protein [Planctomycetota bacterium]
MPIYEYTCEGCDEAFEALVRSKSTRVTCPKCGGKRVKRGFSSFAAGAAGTDGGSHAEQAG